MVGLVQITWSIKRKYRRFNAHYFIFSFQLRHARVNTARRCLFRLIELQPAECLFNFWRKIISFFFIPPSIVFETVLFLCQVFLNLPLLFTNFRQWPFSEKKKKKTIQGCLHLICLINGLQKQATCKRKKWKQRQKQARWLSPSNIGLVMP